MSAKRLKESRCGGSCFDIVCASSDFVKPINEERDAEQLQERAKLALVVVNDAKSKVCRWESGSCFGEMSNISSWCTYSLHLDQFIL